MWTTLRPLLASQTYDMGRLMIASLLIAAAGPPVLAWWQRHRWRFALRIAVVIVFLTSVLLLWLAPVFARLLQYARDPYGSLVDCDHEVVVLVAVLSALITWAVCRPQPGRHWRE